MNLLFWLVLTASVATVSFLLGAPKAVRRAWGASGLLVYAVSAVLLATATTFGVLVLLGGAGDSTAVVVVVTSGVTTAALAASVKSRPAARTRRAGSRKVRVPFFLLGKVVTLAVPVGLGYLLVEDGLDGLVESRVHVLILPLVIVAGLFLDAALRRQKAEDEADAVIGEGAVVYIRGFDLERTRFARTSANQAGTALGVTYKSNRLRRGTATFGEFFAPTVRERLGPWQHMGNLTDYLPPHGGTPVYTDDDQWREQFTCLVEHSRCVITFPHFYRQLRYELSVIRSVSAHQRLFVLTPPSHSRRKPEQITVVQWERWKAFATAAARPHEGFAVPGYDLGEHPGPGAVVAFDTDGNAVVLRTRALTPLDYVSTIQEHLDRIARDAVPRGATE